jgi:type VI secretion system secreted protein Hcp
MKRLTSLLTLTTLCLLTAGTSQAAFTSFLVFKSSSPTPKTEGESQDQTFEKAIELRSFSFGVDNPSTLGSASGGAGTGKATFVELNIDKTIDSASPSLFRVCAAGQHYDTVTLSLRQSSSTGGVVFAVFTFKLVFVKSVNWSGSSGDDTPAETVKLVYGAMQVSYRKQNSDGTLAQPVLGTWNQVNNSSDFTVPGVPDVTEP